MPSQTLSRVIARATVVISRLKYSSCRPASQPPGQAPSVWHWDRPLRIIGGGEKGGANVHENTHGQGNQEKDDDMKESFGSFADDRFSDLSDRHSAGPHGNHQGSKVMDSSNKECSETTQSMAGIQPQITAMAGPSMGESPAMRHSDVQRERICWWGCSRCHPEAHEQV